MNIMNKVTMKNLRLNKRRTIVTIVGIIISVAMVTAVAVFASSFIDMFIRSEISSSGEWHVKYKNVQQKQLGIIQEDSATRSAAVSQDLGFAKLNGLQKEEKQHLYFLAFNQDAFQTMPVKLLEGRMPEKDGEVVVSRKIMSEGGVMLKVGQPLTVTVGDRRITETRKIYDDKDPDKLLETTTDTFLLEPTGRVYNAPDITMVEEFLPKYEKTYEIVGILDQELGFDMVGNNYTAITYLDVNALAPEDEVTVKVALEKINTGLYSHSLEIAEKLGFPIEEGLSSFGRVEEKYSPNVNYNTSLLVYYGVTPYNSMNETIYIFAAIVIFIIMTGSISLIYNAFAISVSERAKQFGMLASVGATRKQKRSAVLFEGAFLGCISIPLGILFGIGGMGVTFFLLNNTFTSMPQGDEALRLVISPWVLVVSVAVSAATIFISSLIPAKRAARMAPIDAIRQSADVKLRGKDVRTSRLTRWLFGFEAELALKNLKRNRKKYKATIFSLVVSMVLFIATSGISHLIMDSSESFAMERNFDMSLHLGQLSDTSVEKIINSVKEVEDVQETTLWTERLVYYIAPEEAKLLPVISGYMEESIKNQNGGIEYENGEIEYEANLQARLYAMDDESFANYARQAGIDVTAAGADEYPVILYNWLQLRDGPQVVNSKMLDIAAGDTLPLLNRSPFDSEENEKQKVTDLRIVGSTDVQPMGHMGANSSFSYLQFSMFCSQSTMKRLYADFADGPYFDEISQFSDTYITLTTDNPQKTNEEIQKILKQQGCESSRLQDFDAQRREERETNRIVMIFAYGFIALITAVCMANIFNTISTSISLRKREFAMLKSVGMTPKSFNKMINYESVFYGIKAVLYGLPISLAVILLLYRVLTGSIYFQLNLPWTEIIIAVAAVFVLVGIIMLYSSAKVKKENIIDALKEDNI